MKQRVNQMQKNKSGQQKENRRKIGGEGDEKCEKDTPTPT